VAKAKFSLRRYETQARVSMFVGIASCLCLLALAVLVFHNADWSEWVIYYARPWRRQIVFLAGAVTLLAAVTALGFGFNSAGQRRNTRPRESWLGFFLGAGVVCLALVLLFIFHQRAIFVGQ